MAHGLIGYTLLVAGEKDREEQNTRPGMACTPNESWWKPLRRSRSGGVRFYPGYRSARFHVSTDGTRVYNIVHWASEVDYRHFDETFPGCRPGRWQRDVHNSDRHCDPCEPVREEFVNETIPLRPLNALPP